MDGLAEALTLLQRAERPLARAPALQAITAEPPGAVAAVDGSHAVLVDNGPVWVVATRAMALHWPGAALPRPPRIHATLASEAAGDLERAYAVHGLEAPRISGADGYATALRDLDEMAAAKDAARALGPGGLLLLDGAMQDLPAVPQAMAERILEAAARHGCEVAAVSKRSSRSEDGVPLVPAIARAGRASLPGQAWHTEVGAGHVALLHPRASHAFRIDVTADVWGRLAGLADDAVYIGYPYPLAKVHNAVTITARHARSLQERLVREAGPAARVLADFHHVLDRNVGR